MTIDEILSKKQALVAEGDAIRDRVYGQQAGEWRGDDTAKFDSLMEQSENCTKEAARLAKLDAQRASLVAADQPTGPKAPAQQPNSEQRQAPRNRPTEGERALAMQGWVLASNDGSTVTEQHRRAAERCGIRLDQKNLTIRLAEQAPKSLRDEDLRAWEQRLTQVDVVSPDYGGHYTVPDETMRALEVAMLAHGGMRSVATVFRTNSGAELPTPTLNDTSNTGALLGEGLEHTELDVDFNQLLLHAYKYTSRRVGMSVEYLQDNAIAAASRIGGILGERIARITNLHFTRGDGSAKPNGIVTAATTSSVTTASAAVVSYDNLIDLKHSVDPSYRTGARFMFNDTTLKILKKIKVPQYSGDTSGQPLWRAGFTTAEPDTIDGDPYTINQDVESGSGKKSILYGALSKYLIRDVRDITLVRLDERYAELGIVAFLAFSRHDGDLLDAGTHPVKYLTQGA